MKRSLQYWNKRGEALFEVDGEKFYTGTPLPLYLAIRNEIETLLEQFAVGEKILDFGCGDGYMIHSLSSKKLQSVFYGCDITSSLLIYETPNYGLCVGGIPFEGTTFDCIYCVNVLQHIQDTVTLEKTLSEIASRTSLFIICEAVNQRSVNHSIYIERTREAYIVALEAAGFDIEFERLISYPFAQKMLKDLTPFINRYYGNGMEANRDQAFRELFQGFLEMPAPCCGVGKLFLVGKKKGTS